MSVIIAHGSVETSTDEQYLQGLIKAVQRGHNRLRQDAGARLNAVESVVNELEDNPLYNAGYGSVLNRDGHIEIDASIMDGTSGKFAAVAAMSGVRNGISVAKRLMEVSNHLVLAGTGATTFAREQGFQDDNCVTEEQTDLWAQAKLLYSQGRLSEFSSYTGRIKESDTVGCVLLDDYGNLAAGSSTGGSFFKFPGRVGDTPFIGGGIFASSYSAVVCTGRGEAFIQTLTAKYVDDEIQLGKHPADVAASAIQRLFDRTGETGGLIVVDHLGRFAAVHNCSSFPVAAVVNGVLVDVQPIEMTTV